jgi:hypothetical protein
MKRLFWIKANFVQDYRSCFYNNYCCYGYVNKWRKIDTFGSFKEQKYGLWVVVCQTKSWVNQCLMKLWLHLVFPPKLLVWASRRAHFGQGIKSLVKTKGMISAVMPV